MTLLRDLNYNLTYGRKEKVKQTWLGVGFELCPVFDAEQLEPPSLTTVARNILTHNTFIFRSTKTYNLEILNEGTNPVWLFVEMLLYYSLNR